MKIRRAFTLVELLAVIAIIGVLAAILIPVVGSVRKSARSAQCQSNLRQLGQGYLLYLNDYKGIAPLDNGGGGAVWPLTLMRTVLGEEVANKIKQDGDSGNPRAFPPLVCPSAEVEPDLYYRSSYMMNIYCLSRPGTTQGSNRLGPPEIRPLTLVQSPSRIILAMDAHAPTSRVLMDGTTWSEVQLAEIFRHNNRANAVHLDGHVRAIPRSGQGSITPPNWAASYPWRDWTP